MKRTISNVLAISAAAFASGPLTAATWLYWNGGDGKWSESSSWRGGASAPLEGDNAVVFEDGASSVVDIDTAVKINNWVFRASGGSYPDAVFSWTGVGSLTSTSQSACSLGEGRRLTMDGPRVHVERQLLVGTNAVLVVRSGHLTSSTSSDAASPIEVRKGGVFSVSGGSVDTYGMDVKEEASLIVKGGQLKCATTFSAHESAHVELSGGILDMVTAKTPVLPADAFLFKGGVLRYRDSSRYLTQGDAHLLPPVDGVLDIVETKSPTCFRIDAEGTTSFGGTLVCTNSVASYSEGLWFEKKTHVIDGGGTVLANRVKVRFNTGVSITMKLKKLLLKDGFEVDSSSATLIFPDGIEFGAWDDWTDGSVVPIIKLAGDVKCNTLDCLDGATKRSIQMKNCIDTGMTSLTAEGGGTVDLAFPAGINALESLTVGADTTLALTNTKFSISVRRLKMEADAKILLVSGRCALEVQESPELDDTARIVFAPPSSLAENEKYPLWISGADSEIPDNVEIQGLEGTGFVCGSTLGCHYLTDGKHTSARTDKPEWVGGAAAADWTLPANWSLDNGRYPYGATEVYFSGACDVLSPIRIDLPDAHNYVRQINFSGYSPPYSFSGNALRLTYGATSMTIDDQSHMPVEFNNRIVCTSPGDGNFRNLGSSRLALMGGGSCNADIGVLGDVRLGGEWSAGGISVKELTDAQIKAGARRSRLTICEGGILTTTNIMVSMPAPSALTVYGTLEISNLLTSVSNANWRGNGCVKLHGVDVGVSGSFMLQDSISLYPVEGWRTVSSAAADACVSITVKDSPTLGATCDWTYGPAAGAEPTSKEQDRALVLVDGATLTVDTEDPVSGSGHTITFVEPIIGKGSVNKIGSGTLAFATTNSFVSGRFSVSGGLIAPAGRFVDESLRKKWIRLVTAASFSGVTESLDPAFVGRIVELGDGLSAFEVRRGPKGTVMLVR